MQRKRFSKNNIEIISSCFLLLGTFFTDIKVEVRPSYAGVNEIKFSQQRYNKIKQRLPGVWQVFSYNNEKTFQIFGAKEVSSNINSFFAYLNHQEYIKKYHFTQGAKGQFNEVIEILTQNSPDLIRETDSISSVLKNYFYFYRLLGKKRINLITEILNNESDIIEPLMYTFYLWLNLKNDDLELDLKKQSLERAYIYAQFFLETIGGKNYLFRRDPKVRKLISYYCVLIIDQANREGLNSNGIDIRPHLELTIKDLANQVDLTFKNQYLWQLENLRKKYKLS